jgi:hypothetical protein
VEGMSPKPARNGWFHMPCWNGLSVNQQARLIGWGNLPIDYQPEGWCEEGAQVAIECQDDESPGPRFYCYRCARSYLVTKIKR